MRLSERFDTIRQSIKSELHVYRLAYKHPKTPTSAKWLLGAALFYLLLPFDLIPDFIPVLGHLDDVIIVPGLVYLAVQRIPENVMQDCRREAAIAPH
jgi:uncharacterized membrane protein YkvA (DUF1232 family)